MNKVWNINIPPNLLLYSRKTFRLLILILVQLIQKLRRMCERKSWTEKVKCISNIGRLNSKRAQRSSENCKMEQNC